MSDGSRKSNAFGTAMPIFRVRDLRASLEYYTKVLGFSVDFDDANIVGGVSRDDASLLLCVGDQGHTGGWICVNVDDVDAIHEELRAKGATIRNPPTNYWWGYEMQVADPDGNAIRLRGERRAGLPNGAWLDMNGVRWIQKADGGWSRVENDRESR